MPQRAAFLTELRTAAHEVGFFYVTGHGVDARLLGDLMDSAQRFFSLPEADKLAIEMVNSPHFRGYNRVASELTRGQPDWREQIDIGAERQALPRDAQHSRMGAPERAEPMAGRAAGTACRGHPLAGRSHGSAHTHIARLRAGARAICRCARAPVRRRPPLLDQTDPLSGLGGCCGTGAERAVPRSRCPQGYRLITLLLQDDQGGLQVETPAVGSMSPPRAGTFVINIGELLELASDGYLRATMHRVVSPPPALERLSAAFFLGARLDATVPRSAIAAGARHQRGPRTDPRNPLFHEVGLNYSEGAATVASRCRRSGITRI